MKRIEDVEVGDTIHTHDVLGNPYRFTVTRIESRTEGGSTKWGRVFYDKDNNFITEKTISRVNGIFADSEPIDRVFFKVMEDDNGGMNAPITSTEKVDR